MSKAWPQRAIDYVICSRNMFQTFCSLCIERFLTFLYWKTCTDIYNKKHKVTEEGEDEDDAEDEDDTED